MRKNPRTLTPPPSEAFHGSTHSLGTTRLPQNRPPSHAPMNRKLRRIERVTTQSIVQEVHQFIGDVMVESASMNSVACGDPASVDSALYGAIRVLRECWAFSGDPRDSFESVSTLSPMTIELLLTYGNHQLTPDQKCLCLKNGKEDLPWVGGLLVVLNDYLLKRMDVQTRSMLDNPAGRQVPKGPLEEKQIFRVLLFNCHSFGWLDSIGNESYETSNRYLININNALRNLILDPQFSHNGTTENKTGRTLVLLSNVILMDGGLPSLPVAAHSRVFNCHHQYGRGLACLVPTMPASSPSSLIDSRGLFSGQSVSPAHSDPSTPHSVYSLSLADLKPVSCGERSFPGVAVHAVLLSPSGPLIVHAQFEEEKDSAISGKEPASPTKVSSVPDLLHSYFQKECLAHAGYNIANLVDLLSWLVRLLHSPPPALLVEWHLSKPRLPCAMEGSLGMSTSPYRYSVLFKLLKMYQEFLGTTAFAPVQIGNMEYTDAAGLSGVIEAVLRSFQACEATQFFDGKERPLVFTKDIEVAPETEVYVDHNSVISSLQVRPI